MPATLGGGWLGRLDAWEWWCCVEIIGSAGRKEESCGGGEGDGIVLHMRLKLGMEMGLAETDVIVARRRGADYKTGTER